MIKYMALKVLLVMAMAVGSFKKIFFFIARALLSMAFFFFFQVIEFACSLKEFSGSHCLFVVVVSRQKL